MARRRKKKPMRGSKRGTINPHIGCTEGHLKAQIRSAMRKVWRNSSRRVFIQSIRIPYEGPLKFKWAVVCEQCKKVMGQSQKEYGVKKDGSRTKGRKLVYEIDHIDGNPPFINLEEDLGKYAHSLLFGKLRCLCRSCHADHTALQVSHRTDIERRRNKVIPPRLEENGTAFDLENYDLKYADFVMYRDRYHILDLNTGKTTEYDPIKGGVAIRGKYIPASRIYRYAWENHILNVPLTQWAFPIWEDADKNLHVFDNYACLVDSRFWSFKKHKWITRHDSSEGYLHIKFYEAGVEYNPTVHKTVALTHVVNPKPGIFNVVNHKDTDRLNNESCNLEWTTQRGNVIHAHENGCRDDIKRLDDEDVHAICIMLEAGFGIAKIRDEVEGVKYTTISKIRAGKVYTNISKQYDFSNIVKRKLTRRSKA